MRPFTILLALTFLSTLAFADDKESGNNLRVKINHVVKVQSTGEKIELQFMYDTTEWLHISNYLEDDRPLLLRRNEVASFKALLDKMTKFGDAVYKNQITGVKKEFKGEMVPSMIVANGTLIDIAEDVSKPFSKTSVHVKFGQYIPPGRRGWSTKAFTYPEIEELSKIFDEKQKEVFKKYDLLKALND